MEEKPNNQQAFPQLHMIDGNWNTEPLKKYSGMTLRDYFAAKAMQGYLANKNSPEVFCNDEDIIDLADDFYRMADAMLKQREL